MVNQIVNSSAQKTTLTALNQVSRTIETVTKRLATGLKVSTALDNPQNFFTARALSNRANDLSNLLDGINQNIRVIQQAANGVESINTLLNQAEAIATESQNHLLGGTTDPAVEEVITQSTATPLTNLILGESPVAYYRLNDSGNPAINLGSGGATINGNFTGGVSLGQAPLYDNASAPSARFDGNNDIINIPDSALINLGVYTERTVELVFNAETTAGRQVLYEEGAGVNGFTIYIDNGLIRVTGEDDTGLSRWFDADISAPIVAGETNHIAFVFDQPNNSFTGYLNGAEIGSVSVANSIFPSHSGNIGIGGAPDGVQFHDGESNSGGFNFQGRISDVAIHNNALSEATLLNHSQSLPITFQSRFLHPDFEETLNQIDRIAIDTQYRGINLLNNESLITTFNEKRTSLLITEGDDLTADGLGLKRSNFNDLDDIEDILFKIREARATVRSFGSQLSNDLGIIQTRQDFTKEFINTHIKGAENLTIADANKEAANQLALQTRQSLATTSLTLANQSQQQVLGLFR